MKKFSSDHLLNLISEAYPGLVTYINKDFRYEFANKEYYNWFHLPSDESIIGKKVEDVIGADIFEHRKPLISRVLNGETVKFNTELDHKKLGRREIEQVYKPDIDQDGSIIGFIGLAYDITEQKKAENLARENEARFRSLTDMMPQLVWVSDAQGNVEWLNEKWCHVTGTTMEENLGDGWIKTIHPEDRASTMSNWRDGLVTLAGVPAEYRMKMADGTYRWHMARAVAVTDERDHIIRWVGTTTDINDQKEIEVHQTRLLQVLESSSDFIGIADIHGNGIYLNRAGQLMIGADNPGSKKMTILDCFMEEDKDFVRNVILPTTAKEGKWVGDFRFRNFKTGKPIWVHYNSFVTRDEKTGEATGFATVSRDITELKQKELKLEEALKARDHFLSIASHELKTPLTSLKLQAQLTLRNITSKKEITYDKILAMAIQNNELVDRLTHLIDDMLDVSRINTGKLRLNITRQELGDIVREVVFRMGVLFEAAGLKLPGIHVDEKFFGEWDRFRLEQVVGNLLTNAIRYGRGKEIGIKIFGNENQAILAVRDEGYGISKNDQKRIFERFERAINSSEVSGLGLGLFISREIVEAHSGKIWVESEIDHGSTFYISLPLKHTGEKS